MHCQFFVPAFRRNDAPSGARWFGTVLLVALWCSAARPATAHEGGHDDMLPGTATPAPAPGLPRLVTKSEAYELVGILRGERLTIYLDRFEDNSPVTDASITVAIDGEVVAAET